MLSPPYPHPALQLCQQKDRDYTVCVVEKGAEVGELHTAQQRAQPAPACFYCLLLPVQLQPPQSAGREALPARSPRRGVRRVAHPVGQRV